MMLGGDFSRYSVSQHSGVSPRRSAMNEESLFYLAQQQPDAAARAAFLDEACANQPEVRARLEKLLEAHDAPVSLFNKPAVEMDTTLEPAASSSRGSGIDEDSSFSSAPPAEKPGTRIGPYKLLQQIGEGGMGVVWMAEQEHPVRRKVALKLIKAGMDSKSVLARFEAERQALALMDHPNIAKVLDGGTTESGRPFFVMEYVKGVPFTKYCDDARLSIAERLALFVPVCKAIQHAHQKGIIHRDLKPSNVLVTLYDGKPVPKVIDFGVAKAIEQRLTERTLFTQYGSIIGTFEYMSPEQAEMSALGIDTRSDIYSLGVLLYELLTGTTPLERQRLRTASYAEIVRLIREEEPPKPSTRLSSSQTLPLVAAARKTEPAKLAKLFRGELDWIVVKALEKDRNRRYETASAFAADVQRYLDEEPVLACPPSAWYRFRKFVRRNKRALTSVTAVAGSLLMGLLVTIVLLANHAAEMKEEHERTRKECDRAETALGLANRNLERADRNLALALEALDDVYMKDVEDRILRDRRMTEAERASLQKGLQFYERFAQQNSGHAGLERATAKAHRRIGFLRLDLKDYAEAQANFAQAIAAFEQWADESHGSVEDQDELARLCYGMTVSFTRAGQYREAMPSCHRAIALLRKLSAEYPQVLNHRIQLGLCLWEVSGVWWSNEQPGQAEEEALREALRVFEALAAEHPEERYYRQEVARCRRDFGIILLKTGRAQQATESLKRAALAFEALASETPGSSFYRQELGVNYSNLADSLRKSGQAQEAEDALRHALTNYAKAIELDPKNA